MLPLPPTKSTILPVAMRGRAGVDDPIERVFALLNGYRNLLLESGCRYGSPIGSIALELRDPDERVRKLLSINFFGWVDHLAAFVLTTMEGGVMQARTHRTLEAFDASVA